MCARFLHPSSPFTACCLSVAVVVVLCLRWLACAGMPFIPCVCGVRGWVWVTRVCVGIPFSPFAGVWGSAWLSAVHLHALHVTYLRSWWWCVAPSLPTTHLRVAAYLSLPMQAGGCGYVFPASPRLAWLLLCVSRGAACMICVFLQLRVVLSRGCVWFPSRVLLVILGVLRIPPYHYACSRRWWSCCASGSMHGRAYHSLPFAPYVSGRAGGGGHVGTSRGGLFTGR